MGHYCRICGRERANEKFSGKGHRDHVCRDWDRLPKEEFELIEVGEELWGFVEQSNISTKNRIRLESLTKHPDVEIREMAGLLLRVSAIKPGKRKRWQKVKAADPELYAACERIGWTEYPY
ncbi:MAG: hypothetical protein O3A87_06120 [Verrucomicrobia bacterium]|nr:hypothetical protein [Verrucomicrobiota bacterium]MDA1006042.1 hypothetical protein [Verrucomicrobiota bacterium]